MRLIAEATNEGRTVHFAYASGSYAVFIEQGSSASEMTAAKITDIRSRLPQLQHPSISLFFGLGVRVFQRHISQSASAHVSNAESITSVW